MKYLLDTCIISEFTKPSPEPKVVDLISFENEENLFLSVLTLGEIHKGIAKLPDSKKKKELANWVETDLKKRFAGRIIKITEEIACHWGDILGQSEKAGRKIPVIDGLLAATAIKKGLTLVTRNIKDVVNCGCKILNPWE